ncbi:MAG TPA: YHYH protein [Planctomycetota bacterium]|nr:YHYH protein [Planctomycetota bacterium]
MKKILFVSTLGACALIALASENPPPNLVQNGGFEARDSKGAPAEYELHGNAVYRFMGDTHRDYASMGVALDSGGAKDTDGDVNGSVAQAVKNLDGKAGRWFRFSMRGLPQDNFAVSGGDVFMKADFYGGGGKNYFDGITKKIYGLIEQDRKDFAVNGDFRTGGAAVWRTYQFDFRLPFSEVDEVHLSVGFTHGSATVLHNAAFFVDDFSLERIPDPAGSIGSAWTLKSPAPPKPQGTLVPLGGHWYFDARNGEAATKKFDASNANRLFYKTGEELQTPFAGNMSAWMRAGFKDERGAVVTQDTFVPDSVTLEFTATHLIMHAKNIPNHPTAKFPEEGYGPHNPNYIQAHNYTYYLPLNPEANPKHYVTDTANSNGALHMGAIGVAVNGVVFYNPFDAGSMDASNIMDRCCGHPSQDNRYHYHKYPICVKSPWADEGTAHSGVLGWAFDGFPVYGPYESAGVMAKDLKGENALNTFNMHYDKERGWHYHVTPGKFPYIIGGFWGAEDSRNADRRGPGGPRGPGER